jgi:ornithine cyclodeaminase/alanine dehydrogenase-like protein (mu-crystallin family)
MTLLLNAAETRAALPMPAAIETMRTALREFSDGQVVQPLRHMVRSPGGDVLAVMPAWAPAGFGLKTVVIKPGNPDRGLPAHLGLVTVFDPVSGVPLAVMDGAVITAIRTAAVSAVATDALARPDARVLAVLGAGVQAREHLRAMLAVRTPSVIRVWNHRPERARELAAWAAAELDVAVTPVGTVKEAAFDADIVCATTASPTPILESGVIADGAHVNAVGSSFPDRRELTGDLIGRAAVFVDSRASALAEAGDLVLAFAEGAAEPSVVRAEVGEVLLGRHPGRITPGEITVFKSLGLAVEDVLAGFEAYRRALAAGVGRSVDSFLPITANQKNSGE